MDEVQPFVVGALVTIVSVTIGAVAGPLVQERYARRAAKRAGKVALVHLRQEVAHLEEAALRIHRRWPGSVTDLSTPTLSSRADDLSEILTIDELINLMRELKEIRPIVDWYQAELQSDRGRPLDQPGEVLMESVSTRIETVISTVETALKR